MASKTIKYFVLLYSMYFIGHFGMSMVYGFGRTALLACGMVLCAAVIFTFWKAAGRSEGKKEIHYGIFSGFFIWCFLGEFLEHEEIMVIAGTEALPALIAYMLMTALIVYRRYLPTGTRFALGHFGCVWLLHFILVNQAEGLQTKYPEVFQSTIIVTGLVFILTALYCFFKLMEEQSESACVAYLLLTFIFLWATVETLQVMHIVPDYTYYAYWIKKLSPGSRSPTHTDYFDHKHTDTLYMSRENTFTPPGQKGTTHESMHAFRSVGRREETMKNQFQSSDSHKQKIASLKDLYTWENKATQNLACSLWERFPALLAGGDITRKLDEMMKQKGKKVVDREMLCTFMEKSFLATTVDTFKSLLKKYVQQFKEEKAPHRDYSKAEAGLLKNVRISEKVREKILFIRAYYDWDNEEIQELVCYLLERFPSLLLTGDLITIVDAKMEKKNKNTVDETLFFQGMEAAFLAAATVTFDSFIKRYIQQFK